MQYGLMETASAAPFIFLKRIDSSLIHDNNVTEKSMILLYNKNKDNVNYYCESLEVSLYYNRKKNSEMRGNTFENKEKKMDIMYDYISLSVHFS